jgi:hypothetical protein
MPYAPDSLLTEPARGTRQQWQVALTANGADRPAEIVQAYFELAAQAGLNADLALAQAVHETGWFTSDHWLNERNPAGIGITGPDVVGEDFGTIQRGVQVHLAHLGCYVFSAATCPKERFSWHDPRHFFHDNQPAISGLIGPLHRWAVPGTNYVAAIVRIANQVVHQGGPATTDDARLEAAYQAHQRRLGFKRFAGLLRRSDWGDNTADSYRVLLCERGALLLVGGQVRDVTPRCIDDFVTFNEQAGTLQALPAPTRLDLPLATRQHFIPAGNVNRPGRPMTPTFITVHSTDNTNIGANAESHRGFTHNGGGDEHVSFHWVVDDHEAIQLLPHTEDAFHAGDGNGPGNRRSIGIETCVNADGDFERAKLNLASLLAMICAQEGIPVENIKQHNHFSPEGKNCPRRMRATNNAGFNAVISRVRALLAGGVLADSVLLNLAHAADQGRLGGQRFSGLLRRRDWGDNTASSYPMLVCQRGALLLVNEQVRDVTARCIDDFVTFNEQAGTLLRF